MADSGEPPRYWTAAEANAALPRVGALVEQARRAVAERRESADALATQAAGNGHASRRGGRGLEAVLAELAADGIVLRDPDRGLIDFPALAPSGRMYWLCWLAGEPEVAWWHWPEDGFPGRTPLSQPPA